MMVDIDADKFAELSSTAEFPEIANEASRVPSQAYYGSVDIDNEGARSVDFSASGKANIYRVGSKAKMRSNLSVHDSTRGRSDTRLQHLA